MTKLETYGIQIIGMEYLEEAVKNKRIDPQNVQSTLDMMNRVGLNHFVIEFDKDGMTFHNPVRH